MSNTEKPKRIKAGLYEYRGYQIRRYASGFWSYERIDGPRYREMPMCRTLRSATANVDALHRMESEDG